MEPLIILNEIVIDASAAKVWNALVNPEETKKYMFGCETVSNWKVGSSLVWKMDYEGKELVAVKGNILAYEPNRLLSYTVIDPNSAIPDKLENYLTVTYRLEDTDGKTKLTVTQGDYSKVADGERRYQESYNNGEGWQPILQQIKDQVTAS